MRRAALAALLLAALLVPVQPGAGLHVLPEPWPCLLPDQVEDVRVDLDHLMEDTHRLANLGAILATLAPAQSPHVKRLTLPTDLVIAHPLVLANIDLRVCGDVWVLPTGSLTLYGANLTIDHPTRPGLLRVMGLEVPTDRTAPLLDTGTLRAAPLASVQEDELLGEAPARLLFTHPDRPSVIQGGERPFRLSVEQGAKLLLEEAEVLRTTGIEATGAAAVRVHGGRIASVGQGLYLFQVAGARVEGTRIEARTEGVYATTARDAVFRGVDMDATTGFHLTKSEGVRIVDATVRAGRDGVYAFDTHDVHLARSSLEGVSGFYAATSHRAVVEDNTVRVSGTALTLTDSRDAVLRANDLQGAGEGGVRGVYLERTSHVLVDRNAASRFDTGVHLLTGEDSVLTCNVLTGNHRGAYVSTTVDVVLRDNVLAGNDLLDLHGFLAPRLDAAENYWGQPEGPGKAKVFAGTITNITVAPWLAAPASCPDGGRDHDPPGVGIVRPRHGSIYLFDGEHRVTYGQRALLRPIVAVGALTVLAEASDGEGPVREVRFLVDGELQAVRTAPPYAFQWDPPLGTLGARLVEAVAVDAAGNEATDAVLVVARVGLS